MRYIEQIPRTEDSPFWTTELMDIEAIREWIVANCDITKRHVISSFRGGRVIAEGVQLVRYYGWSFGSRRGAAPCSVTLPNDKTHHNGYKLFNSVEDATNYYRDSKVIADSKLDMDEEKVGNVLSQLKADGVNLDAFAEANDDSGLECGLCVSCTVNGFYFGRRI